MYALTDRAVLSVDKNYPRATWLAPTTFFRVVLPFPYCWSTWVRLNVRIPRRDQPSSNFRFSNFKPKVLGITGTQEISGFEDLSGYYSRQFCWERWSASFSQDNYWARFVFEIPAEPLNSTGVLLTANQYLLRDQIVCLFPCIFQKLAFLMYAHQLLI